MGTSTYDAAGYRKPTHPRAKMLIAPVALSETKVTQERWDAIFDNKEGTAKEDSGNDN